jgi:branched-chain amino acid transport system permease protein
MKSIMKKNMPMKTVFAAVFLLLPVIMTAIGFNYGILVACVAMLYAIAVSGLDIDFGYCGQISMGHAAFFAIGAYGSVMLNKYFSTPIFAAMLIASVLATIVGSIVAYPASKLVFHFLSLATIAFGEIVYTLLLNSPGGVTGNAVGMFAPSISMFGYELSSYMSFYYFGLAAVAVFLLAKYLMVNSKVGRAWIAIRENPVAAGGMGINVTKYKVMAFAVSAFYTGFAGAMYAHLMRYIGPDTFTQKQSIMFVTMMLFGGTGSIAGPVVGVVVVLLLIESLRMFEQYQMLMYGLLLLLVVVMMPGGLYGSLKGLLPWLKGRREGGKIDAA